MTIQLNLTTKYRIIVTAQGYFKLQQRLWYWPFWIDTYHDDSLDLERAKAKLDEQKKRDAHKLTVVYSD